MSTDPGFDPKRAIEAGLRAVEQGRPEEGVQIAEETLRRAGKYPGAYFLKAWALRALGDPAASPAGDLALRKPLASPRLSARELERRAEAWRPWRAYAAQLLWSVELEAEVRA